MDSYNKKNLNIAGVIAGLSILIGLVGYQLTHEYIFLNIMAIVMGLNLVYFSHDLTMERVVKYNLNYKFYRGAYMFVGLVFVLGNIIWLIKNWW